MLLSDWWQFCPLSWNLPPIADFHRTDLQCTESLLSSNAPRFTAALWQFVMSLHYPTLAMVPCPFLTKPTAASWLLQTSKVDKKNQKTCTKLNTKCMKEQMFSHPTAARNYKGNPYGFLIKLCSRRKICPPSLDQYKFFLNTELSFQETRIGFLRNSAPLSGGWQFALSWTSLPFASFRRTQCLLLKCE